MPRSSTDIVLGKFIHALVMGPFKVGKTRTIVEGATRLPPLKGGDDGVYVLASEHETHLSSAQDVCKFTFDMVHSEKDFDAAMVHLKSARYRAVVWDTISAYDERVTPAFEKRYATGKGEVDARLWSRPYRRHILACIRRLFDLPCHIIVNSHYADVKNDFDGVATTGDGIVAMLSGQARMLVGAEFQDVFFMYKEGGKRMFLCEASGVWGPGARSLPGVKKIEADLPKLLEAIQVSRQGGTITGDVQKPMLRKLK